MSINSNNSHPTLVMGDADGSVPRLIMGGFLTGKIEITDLKGFELLSILLNEECKVAHSALKNKPKAIKKLTAFQENEDLKKKHIDIQKYLQYQKSNQSFVALCDIEHDRFSCNKDVTRKIVKGFHEAGAIFIRGNHDYGEALASQGNGIMGERAKDSFHEDLFKDRTSEWEKYANEIYVNAYYDSETNNFYVHHGLKLNTIDNQKSIGLETVFGIIELDEEKLNNCNKKDYLKSIIETIEDKSPEESKLHHFRPSDTDNEDAASKLGINIIHGHTDEYKINKIDSKDTNKEQRFTINLNSRREGKIYPTLLIV